MSESASEPTVLGIETSCDDTAAAVVAGDGRVLSSVVSSQLDVHQPFGGVVPEIASREHLANWPAVEAAALKQAGISRSDIDMVAATRAPGLIGALLVGLSLGKGLAYGLRRPFHAVHHLEGHLYSPFLDADGGAAQPVPRRFCGLVVSGGHTALYSVTDVEIDTVAETRDDAFGEVFDKVGKRLGLPYPQGPIVDQLAARGDAANAPLPVAACSDGSLDFSYSGLKSQTLVEIEKLENDGASTTLSAESDDPDQIEADPRVLDLVAGFRAAAVAQVIDRLERLAAAAPFETLAVSGGAAANRLLRAELTNWAADRSVDLRLVPLTYSSDNAAMIAFAALLRHRRGSEGDPFDVEAAGRQSLAGF